MSLIIGQHRRGVNFVSLHATDWGFTNSNHTSFTDTLSIGAEPTGSNRRFVFLMMGLSDNDNQAFLTTSCPIAGINGTSVTASTAENGASGICYREVSTGTTASCTTDYVSTPTVGNVYMMALSVLTGADGLTIVDSGSNYSGSTQFTVSTTLTGMGDGHAILAVTGMREGNSVQSTNGVTLRLDTGASTDVFGVGYDFDRAADASLSVGFNPTSTTSMGISAVAIEPA